MKNISPNYKRLYWDMITMKYPEKIEICKSFLSKEELSVLDVMLLNEKIFSHSAEEKRANQRHRSYDKSTILKILDYQKKNKMNNTQLALHFNLSRNTITKWKRIFLNI